MMVPKSFQYGAVTSRTRDFDEKESRRKNSYNSILSARVPAVEPTDRTPTTAPASLSLAKRPNAQSRAASEPLAIPSSSSSSSSKSLDTGTMPSRSTRKASSSKPAISNNVKHQPDALSPSVAALLAMTTIPPRRSYMRRGKSSGDSRMSIDELVSSWKNDSTLRPSAASSPSMSILLEDVDDVDTEDLHSRKTSVDEPSFGRNRSTSTDSIPSLYGDEQSLSSARSPSTPASLRSRRSNNNLRREKLKSSSTGEDCALDHPLILPPLRISDDDDHEEVVDTFPHTKRVPTAVKARSSFRSNLTTSLQALKNAALGTLTFKTNTSASSGPSRDLSPNSSLADNVLWSHPFLFPRLSSEIRPAFNGTPTQAQRRYMNPMPLTFEEQEAPFQQALHAPYLAQPSSKEGPAIQLQVYNRARSRKVNRSRSRTPDPQSEAGRAQSLASGIRQREVRENGDFLRVVVLEMNMRRAGKLETGRARIWLPPRQVVLEKAAERVSGQVPARWTAISAS